MGTKSQMVSSVPKKEAKRKPINCTVSNEALFSHFSRPCPYLIQITVNQGASQLSSRCIFSLAGHCDERYTFSPRRRKQGTEKADLWPMDQYLLPVSVSTPLSSESPPPRRSPSQAIFSTFNGLFSSLRAALRCLFILLSDSVSG